VQARSNFHLAPDAVARVEAAGFADVVAWNMPLIVPVRDGAQFAQAMLTNHPRYSQVAAPDEQRRAWQAEIARRADEVLAQRRPIALEVLCIAASRR
jgi:hypothetical protein